MTRPLLDDLSGLYDKEKKYTRSSIFRRGGAYIIDAILLHFILSVLQALGLTTNDLTAVLYQPVLLFVYGSLLENSSLRATFGKVFVGIRVISEDESYLSSEQVVKRNLLKVLLSWMPFVMLILLNIDKEKRGLHDRWADMRVVLRATEPENENKTPQF